MTISNEYTPCKSVSGNYYIVSPMELIRKVAAPSSLLEPKLFELSPKEYYVYLQKEYEIKIIDFETFIGYYFTKESECKKHLKELNKKYKIFKRKLDLK